MTFQVPITHSFGFPNVDFSFTPTYGVNWTRLQPFTFPDITVGNTTQTAVVTFGPTKVAEVQRTLDRSLPISEFGFIGSLVFHDDGDPLFYIGGGWSSQEEITRETTFERTTMSGIPIASSLGAVINAEYQEVWRLIAGWRILGVLDLRLDASGPIGGRDRDPVLRVLIGRDFPLTRQQ